MCCGCSTNTPHEGYVYGGCTSWPCVFESLLSYANTPKQDAYYGEFSWAIKLVVCDTVTKPYFPVVRRTVAIQLTTKKLTVGSSCSHRPKNVLCQAILPVITAAAVNTAYLYLCKDSPLFYPRTLKIDKKGRGTVLTLSSAHFPISFYS